MFTIGVFPNIKKAEAALVLDRVVKHLKRYNVQIVMPENDALAMGYRDFSCDLEKIKHNIDLAVTLGGDGTFLQTAREVAKAGIPVCGINLGKLGFLAEIEPASLEQSLDRLISGEYTVQERLMLDAFICRDGQELFLSSALNDAVVTRGGYSRMIRLKLYLKGELTANYPADGLIIATSTGSTGYSLSAGGPIVSPNLNIILITPICPHALHARPMVVAEQEDVRLVIDADHDDIVLTIDGQHAFKLLATDEIVIRRSSTLAKFICLNTTGHFCRLRKKLWQADNEK
ncbi:MAG: ppnK [Firmicutes bacterium]|nr:ppnK [Bacillota bacterium]